MCLFEPIFGRCPDCEEKCNDCGFWFAERSEE